MLDNSELRATPAWNTHRQELADLADSFDAYSQYLRDKNKAMQRNHALPHPVRQLSDNTTVEYRQPSHEVKEIYQKLESALKSEEYVFFDEDLHLEMPFNDYKKKHR